MLKILLVLCTLGCALVTWDGVNADGELLKMIPSADGVSFIRLVNGDSECSGRVEVFQRNQWGTVCDHGWDLREADVVCLELGCGLAENALRGAAFGRGSREIWLRHVQCSGHEASLTQCPRVLHSYLTCTHNNDAGVKCSGTLLMPTLSLLSPHTVFSAGEAVRFSCTVLLGHHLKDFHLYKRGIDTPLVTQRVDSAQTRVELTLSDQEATHQGSYSCLYRIKGSSPSSLLSSPPSNSINITVVELHTPMHWYNTSIEAPTGSVIKGHSFNITCSTEQQYPGGSFQLRLIRSNGTVRQSLPALSPFVTFAFLNAQRSNEGYYYCLYKVQLGGRTFMSRESQPLPISIRDLEDINHVSLLILSVHLGRVALIRPRPSVEPYGDQLAGICSDLPRGSPHHHHHRCQSALQEGEETLRARERDQNLCGQHLRCLSNKIVSWEVYLEKDHVFLREP